MKKRKKEKINCIITVGEERWRAGVVVVGGGA